MKIGILGGSFDPIHNGHLYMAENAYAQYHLDEIWLIPNGNAPHKDKNKMTEAKHRLAMCEIAASQYSYIKVSDMEVCSSDFSYTYLTIQKLTESHPEHEFYFIMGADSLDYFEKWKNPQIISTLCKILVVNRDDFTETDLKQKIFKINTLFSADISIVHCPKFDISSTEIRNKLKEGDVPKGVETYIRKNGLYLSS
uniref:nicotinate-nucleotide adenylyltransferase n=1 Tax=Agathobacter sp. TaxID=2021311 RepID=UPI004057560B